MRHSWALRRGLLVGGAVVAVLMPAAFGPSLPWASSVAGPLAATQPAPAPRFARFGGVAPSPEARYLADWVSDSGDNAGSDFVIVDKKFARLYVFDADAGLRASTPVLLGAAAGDDSVPGIGTRPIAEVQPHERTTPAGRFMGEPGHNSLGHDIVWVDYDAAVSMHRVRAGSAGERRLQRLATPAVDDNRISYGCINVPAAFYDRYIRPTFATRRAPVYVMPEHKSAQQTFGAYDVAAAHGALAGHSASTAAVPRRQQPAAATAPTPAATLTQDS